MSLSDKSRLTDQTRTRAIALYVQDMRVTLKGAIGDFEKLDKNAKRNELLRVGRKRFYKEKADFQDRYYKRLLGGSAADRQCVRACGGADSGKKHQGRGGASNTKKEQPQDHARPSRVAASSLQQQQQQSETPSPKHAAAPARAVESEPKRAKRSKTQDSSQGVVASGRAADKQGEQECQLIKNTIYAKHSMLVSVFGDEHAADVLASSFRFLKEMRPFLQHTEVRVEAAAILGLAAKHSLCLGGEENTMVRQVWKNIVGTASIPAVSEREIRLINAWGGAKK